MGADFGKGKNSNNLSSFLVGVIDKDRIYPLSKVGSGFSEDDLK
jgi:ATP-dependent DNA ligase